MKLEISVKSTPQYTQSHEESNATNVKVDHTNYKRATNKTTSVAEVMPHPVDASCQGRGDKKEYVNIKYFTK
jgi:hypothetical protein